MTDNDPGQLPKQYREYAPVYEDDKFKEKKYMHHSTFEYLKPTDKQIEQMTTVRKAAAIYCNVLETMLPDGPDKTYIIRAHRSNAMWANVAITRLPDGTPRTDNNLPNALTRKD